MKLHYRLEETVEIDGQSYPLHLSFDVVLRLFDVLKDPKLSEPEKVILGLNLMLGVSFLLDFDTQYEIFSTLLKTFELWKEPKPRYDMEGNELKPKLHKGVEHFSFLHDADYIYAGFYQAYGIDLMDEHGKLRWEKFIALFNGLPEDTLFKGIIDIRKRPLPKGKHAKEAKKELEKAKEYYALPGEGEKDEQN